MSVSLQTDLGGSLVADRSRRDRYKRAAIVAGSSIAVALVLTTLVAAFQETDDFRDSPFLRVDPARVVTSARDSRLPCGECHTSEYEAWQTTSHATGFETMHRSEGAKDYLAQMGLRVTKRSESLCMRCHYTVSPDLKAIAGVSCESCHGPARDWLNIHNDFGDGVSRPQDETPAHREQRIQQSEAAGMFRPSGDVYGVAANCFECHTVPLEDLVNTGGHNTGSGGFELVEWATRIQHNFAHEQWGEAGGNRPAPIERQRIMYVVGSMLSYEFGLRGLSAATETGRFSRASERRVKDAFVALEGVSRTLDIPEVSQILAVGAALDLVPDNQASLMAAAEQIRTLGQRFTAANDGSALSALDPLMAGQAPPPPPPPLEPTEATLPATEAGQAGAAAPVAGAEVSTGQATGGAPAGGSQPAAAAGSAGATPAPQPAAAQAPPVVPELPGSVRTRPEWFASPARATIQADCTKCHAQAEEWYYDDRHESTHQRLVNKEPKAVEIARLYGLNANQMSLGTQMCMNCHGSVETGAAAVTVRSGVSCESCHGGAEGYFEPHEKGDDPFALGMTRLKDGAARAANCSRCHLITDVRLLSAGHPSGDDYDFAAANKSIEHYPDRRLQRGRAGDYPAVADAALASAYQQVRAARAIPSYTVAVVQRPRPPAPVAAPAPTTATVAPLPTGATTGVPPTVVEPTRRPVPEDEVRPLGAAAESSRPPRPPAVLPAPSRTTPPTALDALGALPDSTSAMTTEQLMLLVKRRLDLLYRILGRGN